MATMVYDPQAPAALSGPSSSASGLLSFLEDENDQIKIKALSKLYKIVDIYWAEICDKLPLLEELSEDINFPAADLAAAVASQCFYHLQEYSEALKLALSAGKYFDISVKSEYIDTLLAKCIDDYKSKRLEAERAAASGHSTATATTIDPRIENILEQMFQRCYRDSCYEQAMGIALDTRRLDKVEQILSLALADMGGASGNQESILQYTYNLCQGARNITSREFRLSVMDLLTQAYQKLADPDYSNMCLGLQYLNRPVDVANALHHLLAHGTLEQELMAYQIAFQLLESENQGFVLKVWDRFQSLIGGASSAATDTTAPAAVSSSSNSNNSTASPISIPQEDFNGRVEKLQSILVDGLDIDLMLNFLFKHSKTDMSVLQSLKTATDGKSAILHNVVVVAHSFLNAGTTRDTFLRNNLDWLGKASNWSKFTAVGSIGVVHKGHVHESMNLLKPYLPQPGGMSASPYSESGALYALGLIHANKGGNGHSVTINYLVDALRNSGNNEVVQHGACLGIGLAGMATGDDSLFDSLNQILFTDSAVAGEAAALGIGLLCLGQADSPLAKANIPVLLTYAHDTTHEKITRSLGLAIAMIVYGQEEAADVLIDQLMRDRDPILRYGGMFAIAMAYCGTGDNQAIKKLLHVAVSDVNDDVRRAAVISLGFVNFRQPETVPKLVSLLAESFNPHVRYGACMAIGIACVGTAQKAAIDILTPMLQDPIDYVRQGALIAMAFVLQQVSEARSPSVKKFREHLTTVLNDKHQPVMTKSGAILATGILDIGGKNCLVSLSSRSGFMKMGGAVGMLLFVQYWYWYPLYLFLSLSFSTTALIALNQSLDMPTDFSLACAAPLSMFDYVRAEDKRVEDKKHVATAVLSTTMKAKAKEARKARMKGSTDGLHTPVGLERTHSHLSTMSYLSIDDKGGPGGAEEPVTPVAAKKEKEATSFTISNPSRVLPAQYKFISLNDDGAIPNRYSPVSKRSIPVGIIMLINHDPSRPETVAKVEKVALDEEDEAQPPEPFEWDPSQV